jgi:drug/metabolite transporter (DMT)-like permease
MTTTPTTNAVPISLDPKTEDLVDSDQDEHSVEITPEELADTPPEEEAQDPKLWLWLVESFVAQTLWGLLPVYSRYLQTTIHVPAMLLAWTGLAGLFAWKFPQAIYQSGAGWLRNKWLWFSAIVQLGRTVTNFQSHYFTSAVYVQLISLSAPFFGAFLGKMTSAQPMPRLTLPCLIISLLGGVMLFAGSSWSGGAPDDVASHSSSSSTSSASSAEPVSVTLSDWIGMGLQLFSSFCLALGWFISKKLSLAKVPLAWNTASNALLNPFFIPLIGWAAGENWRFWQLDWTWGGYVAWVCVVVTASAGISLNIHAISKLSSPTIFAAITPLRLVVALIAGWLVLGEGISGALQWVGLLLVFVTVTLYLVLQAAPWLTLDWLKLRLKRQSTYELAGQQMTTLAQSD